MGRALFLAALWRRFSAHRGPTVRPGGQKNWTEVVQVILLGADVEVLAGHLTMRVAGAPPFRSACPITPTIFFKLAGPLTEG